MSEALVLHLRFEFAPPALFYRKWDKVGWVNSGKTYGHEAKLLVSFLFYGRTENVLKENC